MAEILIVDDDELMCASLTHVARRGGHQVRAVQTLAAALTEAPGRPYDVLFLDVRMPDGSGLDVIPALKGGQSEPEIIIMTGFGDAKGAELAIRSGAWDYIQKGSSVKEITLSLERALEYRKQKRRDGERSVVSLKRDGIIGSSLPLRQSLDLVAQAACSEAGVLIAGETGTGKELFARAVHQNSRRAGGKFVVVDCAALPDTLIESILFGHEKGAFTGADSNRDGLILQANGGTLFLDEVGELPLSLQKAFLRVLQEHRFRPLGSRSEISSDFRVVAATNRDLRRLAGEGSFREDLLFRLEAFVIDLPPLRERREDLADLARYHVDRLCSLHGLPPKAFSPDFVDSLARYPWPGNVREFVNVIERTVVAAGSEPVLYPKHLPTELRIRVVQAQVLHENGGSRAVAPVAAGSGLPTLHEYREAVCARAERQYLTDLMAATGGNIAEACRISGLSQSRLYALLKSHDLPSPQHARPERDGETGAALFSPR